VRESQQFKDIIPYPKNCLDCYKIYKLKARHNVQRISYGMHPRGRPRGV